MGTKAESTVPVGRNHIIERPRLTRLLDETTARVIMLVAPAGYGKTTLARQWLTSRQHAWYQGNAASSDVAALALGLAEAASTILSGIGRRLREWLPTSPEPEKEVSVIAELLSEDLEAWPDDAWFVIDDYHLLSSEASIDLTQRLFTTPDRRLLLTSRSRPQWSSARELLYGNFLELGQSTLAMTTDEANAVLTNHAQAASGLVALANGWPAVIGLAALTGTRITTEANLPDALYDYFAEEFFASLPETTRFDLCRLSVLPKLDREAARSVLGTSAQVTFERARDAGLFVADDADRLALHPLLRSFLKRKLQEVSADALEAVVSTAASYLFEAESWDDAFALISDFERLDLIDELLSRAMFSLLKEGRIATLREWLSFTSSHHHQSGYRDLAEAELLFRHGLHEHAGILAYEAAEALDAEDPMKSPAYFRAGQSSYLMDKPDRALRHSRAARETARTIVDRRNALWAEFSALVELEEDEAPQVLDEFESAGPQDRDTLVRLSIGRLVAAVRRGGLDSALAEARGVTEIVADASDPTIRSSFWHAYAVALRLRGEYATSLNATDEAERLIHAYSTAFALPHVLVDRAAALIGLRRFRDAATVIDDVEASAAERGEHYLLANAAMLRCRLLLQDGAHGEPTSKSTEMIESAAEAQLSKSMRAELMMTRAAVHAQAGNPILALALVHGHRLSSTYLEPELLARWVRASCSVLAQKPKSSSLLRAALQKTVSTGAFDLLVFAYRLHPAILRGLAAEADFHHVLDGVLTKSGDSQLARSAGVSLDAPSGSRTSETLLTNREREVYSLLAEGQTNREIARTLFISELTAKVHVRNVLRKLGVRTRTQAALKAFRDESY